MTDKLVVDIWSDVMCPWCAIGYAHFRTALAELAGVVEVEMRFMPFELNPAMPPEGRNQAELLAEAYGRSPGEVAAMGRTVEDAADKSGFSMRWQGAGEAPPKWVWNTHDAHKLLRWALAVAGPAVQCALKQGLFAAHFQQRLNMADREVLLDLAEAQGLDRAAAAEALADEALSIAVRMEEQRAADNGITSVPTFVVADKYILQGSADPASYKSALIQLANMEAMA